MRRISRRVRPVLVAGLVSGAVLAPASAAAAADQRHPGPGIAWQACTDPDFKGMQCGTLRVPVDWSRPHSAKLDLALVRRPAEDPSRRLGAMLLNNGRGRSSIEQFRFAVRGDFLDIAGPMAERFDLVAVDTRGVGHSTPIRCSEPLNPEGISYFPKDRAAFGKLVAHNRAFARDCLRRNGRLLAGVDLASTARDFEAVRAALGERRLNWYGIQYSGLLGRTYADLFPGRLRTMTVDSALDDTVSPVAWALKEAGAAEDSFNRFAEWCAGSDRCALKGHDVAAEYDALVARANRDPIPVPGGRPLMGEDVQAGTQGYLNVKFVTWPLLGKAIADAQAGDATGFTTVPDKTFDPVQDRVTACLDTPRQVRTFRGLRHVEKLLAERSPHLGGAVASQGALAGCVGWPIPAKPVDAGDRVWGAPRTLVVQSTHQGHTPHSAGFAFARQLPGSVVLSREGDDYSMFQLSQCVRDATNRYLTDLTLPAPGTLCTD